MKGIAKQTARQWHKMRWLILAIFLFHTSIANAATIHVTANAADSLETDSSCSLREAITNINAGADTYSDCTATGTYAVNDTINLPTGTYTTAITGAGEDSNATGDLDIRKSVTLSGAGMASTIINGGALDRVLQVDPSMSGGVVVTISGVTIQNGITLVDDGGGIENNGTLTVTASTITGNVARSGGGIANPAGTLTVTNSTISSNTANVSGGGIFNRAGVPFTATLTVTNSTISDNTALGSGGGIVNDNNGGTAIATITGSTISGNTVTGASGTGQGGGIINLGAGTLTIANSTISGNSAAGAGGGIEDLGGPLTSTNATISGNSAGNGAGGIAGLTRTDSLSNTIVANQLAGADCSINDSVLPTAVNSLSSDASCGFTGAGNLQGTVPLLGPLQDNGGPTFTLALLPGSPAIDAGNAVKCAAAPVSAVDQRGVKRPQGASCDIGAYEYGYSSFFVIPLPGGKSVIIEL